MKESAKHGTHAMRLPPVMFRTDEEHDEHQQERRAELNVNLVEKRRTQLPRTQRQSRKRFSCHQTSRDELEVEKSSESESETDY